MAKKPEKSLEDLDAELARLEAELAELEGGKAKPKSSPPPPAVPAPEGAAEKPAKRLSFFGRRKETPSDSPPPVLAEEAKPARKLALFGKKTEESGPVQPAASATATAPPAPSATLPPPPSPRDAGAWKREGARWRRVLPDREPPKVLRKLDTQGNVLSEEAAKGESPPVPELGEKRLLSGLLKRKERREEREGKGS